MSLLRIKKMHKKYMLAFGLLALIGGYVAYFYPDQLLKYASFNRQKQNWDSQHLPLVTAVKRSYPIDVRTVGELEAAHSISVASMIRTDQPKIIEIIADGTNVKKGDILVRLDAVPYEKKVQELLSSIQDCKCQVTSYEQAVDWENEQAGHEVKAVAYELEVAQLELNKIIYGDGPLEAVRLFAAMQKAKIKFEELNQYAEDLTALEEQGFLNLAEVRQAKKKLDEEQENYENSKKQHDSFIEHVHPMQIKKAESALKRCLSKQEESQRASKMKIAKSEAALAQAHQQLTNLERQLQEARYELSLTDIVAPSPGMVVLKEEYRSGQKRKPRIGDTLLRGQAILDLPDMSSMIVKTKVREIDLYKIAIGKAVTVEVDAYPNEQFPGTVDFIGVLAVADQIRPSDEKFFDLKISVSQSDSRLRPGMTARVIIHAGKVDDAISLPIHAIFESSKKHYCYRALPNGYFEKQPLEIGMNNEHWVEVTSGLNENDKVCLALPPEEAIVR